MQHIEEFRQHGYVVVDGFFPKDSALELKSEALRLVQRGRSGWLSGTTSL